MSSLSTPGCLPTSGAQVGPYKWNWQHLINKRRTNRISLTCILKMHVWSFMRSWGGGIFCSSLSQRQERDNFVTAPGKGLIGRMWLLWAFFFCCLFIHFCVLLNIIVQWFTSVLWLGLAYVPFSACSYTRGLCTWRLIDWVINEKEWLCRTKE
jgi:hypothetical protein